MTKVLTAAVIEGWRRDGKNDGNARRYIFAYEWETLCDLALKGLASSTASERTQSGRGRDSDNGPKSTAWPDPDQGPCETMAQCHGYARACVQQGREEFISAVGELSGVFCFPDDIELFWEHINAKSARR